MNVKRANVFRAYMGADFDSYAKYTETKHRIVLPPGFVYECSDIEARFAISSQNPARTIAALAAEFLQKGVHYIEAKAVYNRTYLLFHKASFSFFSEKFGKNECWR